MLGELEITGKGLGIFFIGLIIVTVGIIVFLKLNISL